MILIHSSYTHQKAGSAGGCFCPAYKQKSGTAILLFRYLRLWYCLLIRTSNTETHHVCTHTRKRVYLLYIPWASSCRNVLDNSEFTRFQIAKTKRVRRLFQYVLISLTLMSTTATALSGFATQKYKKYFICANLQGIFGEIYTKCVKRCYISDTCHKFPNANSALQIITICLVFVEICQTECALFGNLSLFCRNIWWGRKKAVILHRI